MRAFLVSSLCLFAVLPVANAATVQAGFVAVQASSNQGAAFNSANKTTGDGNSTGSSASGSNATLGAAGGSSVHFSSFGAANSGVSITPFGVSTTSAHTAFSSGEASNGASFNASNQTFGQSNGSSAFTSTTTTTKTNFANNSSKMVAGVGFLNFENAY